MQEKYEIAPEFISLNGNLSEQLNQADAALFSGNKAFTMQQSNKIFMDLGEEWYDLTGLPFVYALWTVHDMEFNKSMVNKIKSIVDYNLKNREQIRESVFDENISNSLNLIKNIITYHLGLEEKEAITEFFRYAFFFGQIEHIPDLHFCE
jgi:chorismate dehydratase